MHISYNDKIINVDIIIATMKTTGPFVEQRGRPIAAAGVLALPVRLRRSSVDVVANIGNFDYDTDAPAHLQSTPPVRRVDRCLEQSVQR